MCALSLSIRKPLSIMMLTSLSYLINVKPSWCKNAKWILSRKGINHALFAFLEPPFIIKTIMHVQKLIEQSHSRSSLPFQYLSLKQVKFRSSDDVFNKEREILLKLKNTQQKECSAEFRTKHCVLYCNDV